MKTEPKHTPTPLIGKLEVHQNQDHYLLFDGDNAIAKVYDEEKANLIVRAVNSHEALLETIRWMAQTLHQAYHVDHPGTFRECKKNVCDAATQAIAQAAEVKP